MSSFILYTITALLLSQCMAYGLPCHVHELYLLVDGQPADATIEFDGILMTIPDGHASLERCPGSILVHIDDQRLYANLSDNNATVINLFHVFCQTMDYYGNSIEATLYIDGNISLCPAIVQEGNHLFSCDFDGLTYDLGTHEIQGVGSINVKLPLSDLNLQIYEGETKIPDGVTIQFMSNSNGRVYATTAQGGKAHYPQLPFGFYNASANNSSALISHNSSHLKKLNLNSPAELILSTLNCYLLFPTELHIQALDRYGRPITDYPIEIVQGGSSCCIVTDSTGSATLRLPPSLSLLDSITIIAGHLQEEFMIDRSPLPAVLLLCGLAAASFLIIIRRSVS